MCRSLIGIFTSVEVQCSYMHHAACKAVHHVICNWCTAQSTKVQMCSWPCQLECNSLLSIWSSVMYLSSNLCFAAREQFSKTSDRHEDTIRQLRQQVHCPWHWHLLQPSEKINTHWQLIMNNRSSEHFFKVQTQYQTLPFYCQTCIWNGIVGWYSWVHRRVILLSPV